MLEAYLFCAAPIVALVFVAYLAQKFNNLFNTDKNEK
jgi:hypothetical protein